MSKRLMLALACSIVLAWSALGFSQNVIDSCKVSLTDMVADDVTDLGRFEPEIGADKLTTKTFHIPRKFRSTSPFVTIGVLYSNLGTPKDKNDIDDVDFVLIVSKKAFKQDPALSLESSLFSDFDGANASVPMKSFDRVEVSKNIVAGGHLVLVSLKCERKSRP
jgi:hypothetical protein